MIQTIPRTPEAPDPDSRRRRREVHTTPRVHTCGLYRTERSKTEAIQRRHIDRNTGLTWLEVLVIFAIITLIIGFLVPTFYRSHRVEAYKVQCIGNLKEIAKMALIYADSKGDGQFPIAGGHNPPAHESFNVMVNFFGDIKPRMFRCPEGELHEQIVDASGKYRLTEATCSYTWVASPLSTRDTERPLSSDKHIRSAEHRNGHLGGMNVVYADTSVIFTFEKDLDGKDGLMKGLVR